MSVINNTGSGGVIRPGTNVTASQFNQYQSDAYNAGLAAGRSAYSNESSNLSDPTAYIQSARDLAEYNTATSQALAREQMRFQEQANALAMDFSANEAQKTRDWQTMMSDTAHQREVADLIKAGLNPVLSANNGAAVGSAANAQGVTSSGAKGTVDTSAINAMTSLYMKAADMAMQNKNLDMQQKQLDAQVLMNALTNDTNRYAATKSSEATLGAASMNSSAHRYAADLDYSTWANGLHNQYAQLGEWIYKALSGLDLKNMFNFSLFNNNKIPEFWQNATYTDKGGSAGAGGGGGGGGAWNNTPSSGKGYESKRMFE